MPVNEATMLSISCDNPACPGNELDANTRTGWTFVSTEVYGQPTAQHVYCCPTCAGTISEVLEAQAQGAEVAPLPA
jgi:hypothetical protein